MNLEFNKIFASVLVALLCMQIFHLISENLISPTPLKQNILGIETGNEIPANAATPQETSEPIGKILSTASVANGEKIAKKCLQCHTFDKGAPHRTGPNLWGVVMNAVAHASDYIYSQAMKSHGGKWTYEALDAYLQKPREYIKGTKMSFVGLSNAQERADLIAYLSTLADSPAPLPQ
ncbi:MAG: c-type cytochrome [Pseudomonadota bacterium]|jgi:cytochrome c|nr:cytochrome c family protein [Alphaproteobacteria bacterium]